MARQSNQGPTLADAVNATEFVEEVVAALQRRGLIKRKRKAAPAPASKPRKGLLPNPGHQASGDDL